MNRGFDCKRLFKPGEFWFPAEHGCPSRSSPTTNQQHSEASTLRFRRCGWKSRASRGVPDCEDAGCHNFGRS